MTRVQDTLAHLLRLEASKAELGCERAERLKALLPQAVQVLQSRGARRVFLFGSLNETGPAPQADVDLAVEGLPPALYFETLAELMHLFGTRVDLVRLEEAPASLQQRVEAEGRPL